VPSVLSCSNPSVLNFWQGLKAEIGIGLNYPRLHAKYARYHWLLNINHVNPA